MGLNILNPEINRMEYIEVFSLLAKAADLIPYGETCVELNKYEDGPTFEGTLPRQPEESVKNETKKSKKDEGTKKKKSWGKWADRLKSLMSEDDEADDDQ
jgi:hypothetical protein